jgi:hypothetical protein
VPDPLHRKNAAEWVMYVALLPVVWIGRIVQRVTRR